MVSHSTSILPPSLTIREEGAADIPAIHEVNCQAFGQEAEARLVDALRAGGYVRLSLVAEVAKQIVGHILFSELTIHTAHGPVAALSLAPMAVLPAFQRHGIGSALVRASLDACCAAGHKIVIVLGHPDYYPRFGFSTDLAEPLLSPYSGPAWMAIELQPGALVGIAGRVQYPPPFVQLD